MALNLIEILCRNQGIDTLAKIDPNTQNIAENETDKANLLLQAVIPSVLAGFYKYTRVDENTENLCRKNTSEKWLDTIFTTDKQKLIQRVAAYGKVTAAEAETKMEDVANDCVQAVCSNANNNAATIKNIFTTERNNILLHLPAAIELGNILKDNTIDDRTNKMEGPVSNLMHTIEKKFSSSDASQEQKNKDRF